MISKIMCMSRSDAARIKSAILGNTYLTYDNVICISINGTPDADGIDATRIFTPEEVASTLHKEHMQNRVLALEFDDIEPASPHRFLSCQNEKPMRVPQALDIIQHIRYWNTRAGNNLLIVHCKAGLCRSGAITRFAGWMLDMEKKVLEDNPQIHNNNWVYSLLYYVYKEDRDSLSA